MLKRACDICGEDNCVNSYTFPVGIYDWDWDIGDLGDEIKFENLSNCWIDKGNLDLCINCSRKIIEFIASLMGKHYVIKRHHGTKTVTLVKE